MTTCRKFRRTLTSARRTWRRRDGLQDLCERSSVNPMLRSSPTMTDATHDGELIGFIASTVEKLRDDVMTMRAQMATKEDLARLEGRFDEKLARLDGRFDEK